LELRGEALRFDACLVERQQGSAAEIFAGPGHRRDEFDDAL
jgi:hypothetical protein